MMKRDHETAAVNVHDHNRQAWDCNVRRGCPWSIPVGSDEIRAARDGTWEFYLSPSRPIPASWLDDVAGRRVLCLAGGGGQQGPLLAAIGAKVVVVDLSPAQLEVDRVVAKREGLELELVEASMDDLSMFADDDFDLIVNPVSNCYVPDVRPVWREAYRVLRTGGELLAAFLNPVNYMFDPFEADRHNLQVRYRLPFSDDTSLSAAERQRLIREREAFQFGHLLEDQIGGQIDAGFAIAGFFEDYFDDLPMAAYSPNILVTRAKK